MNRKNKLLLNALVGFLLPITTLICGLILPRALLQAFGSEVNGLVSSITQFLSFISLLEMGVGPVIQANLYKPLAEKDYTKTSEIVVSAERFYRRIAYIFLVYILILAILFPLVNTEFSPIFTVSLIIIIAISTVAQYFFGATYQVLLNADQKSYIQMTLQIVSVILNTIIGILLINIGASVHIVKLVSATIFVLRPLGQMLYVKKYYKIDRSITLVGEPIKQKWNGFAQHLAATVSSNTSVVVLTLFSSLSNVSIYSIYNVVANGVSNIVFSASSGLESFFGNIIAKDEKNAMQQSFETVEWVIHAGVTIVFTIAAILMLPFVSVYTDGVSDANYYQPTFGALLVLASMVQCLRIPYFRLIKAAGHFKQTQNGSFIMAAINVVLAILLVFGYGLDGVAIALLSAVAFHTIYFVWYLRKNIINRSVLHFAKHIIVDTLVVLLSFVCTSGLSLSQNTFKELFVLAIFVGLIVLGVSIVLNLVFHSKIIFKLLRGIKKK